MNWLLLQEKFLVSLEINTLSLEKIVNPFFLFFFMLILILDLKFPTVDAESFPTLLPNPID